MSKEALNYLQNKISNLLGRAVLKAIRQDSGKIFAQVVVRGKTISDVELLFPFGFKSLPKPGARGVLHSYDGARDNSTLTDVDDKRFGQFPLSTGDSIVYNSDGSRTEYKGDTIIHTAATKQEFNVGSTQLLIESDGIKLTVNGAVYDFTPANFTSSKDVQVAADIGATGTITGTTDVKAGTKLLKIHDHPIVGGSSAPGPTGPNN